MSSELLSGAPLPESTAYENFVGLLPPCHPSSNWEDGPQGGFLTDLTELNLSGWVDLVQEVARGLQALPTRLCLDLGMQVIALLQLLEMAIGSRVLLSLLPPESSLCMYRSLSASSPYIVEPVCPAGSSVWSDLLIRGSNRSRYLHGRYVWIHGASSRPDTSRFLHFEHTSSGGPSIPRATRIPGYRPPVGRATQMRSAIERHIQTPLLQAPQMVPPLCQPLPSSGSWPETPYQQVVQPPSKPKGRGVTFNSSTNKHLAMGGQDADGQGRQRTQS